MGGKHLTQQNRIDIDRYLREGMSVRRIADLLRVSHTTVSRELLSRRAFTPGMDLHEEPSACVRAASCPRSGQAGCGRGRCAAFAPRMGCPRLDAAPFVCNGCRRDGTCRRARMRYVPRDAEKGYRRTLVESRSGVDMTREELDRLRAIVEPALRRGQSPYHIVEANVDVIGVSVRTLYRLIGLGVFPGIRKSILRRAAGMRPRKGKRPQRRIDRKCREGRTLEDLEAFLKENPGVRPAEMDTVEGTRGGRCLLTLFVPGCAVQLAAIRRANDARSVAEAMDRIEGALGTELFRRMFPAIVTDNGSEFTDPVRLETSPATGKMRTRIFYCEAYSSWQKPHVENGNGYLRGPFPKGVAIPDVTQAQVDRAVSHVNSVLRESLGGRSPVAAMDALWGEGTAARLGLELIPPALVDLTPAVLLGDGEGR